MKRSFLSPFKSRDRNSRSRNGVYLITYYQVQSCEVLVSHAQSSL